MKNLIFLCIATAVFILSVIVLNCAPIINGLIGKGKYQQNGDLANRLYGWADYPCISYTHLYNDYKDKTVEEGLWTSQEDKDYHLDLVKEAKKNCLKKKAMLGLEYSAFNINVILGFICSILGILLYSGNNIGKIVGLIGVGAGIIGFFLTYVYIIYSGIIFDSDVAGKEYGINISDPYSNSYITTKSDGAYLKWKDGKYRRDYDEDKVNDDPDIAFVKYRDLGKKQYNYNSEYYKLYQDHNSEIYTCNSYTSLTSQKGSCEYIWNGPPSYTSSITPKYIYDRWLTSIIISVFIVACGLGLAVFGFLLFKNSGSSSSGHVPVK